MTAAVAAPARRTKAELGIIAASVAMIAWGFGPLFVRAIGVSTPTVVVYRLSMGAPVMVAVAWALGGRFTWSLIRDALLPGALFGVSIMVGFTAIIRTSVANASLIGNLMPVVVVLIARPLLGEQVRTRQYVAVVVSMIGLIGIVAGGTTGGDSSLAGDALALGNVLLWTSYFLLIKRLRDRGHHSWALLASVSVVAALVAVPICAVVSDDLGAVDGIDWLYCVLNVLGPGVLGHGLMTWASRHLKVTVSSLLTLGSPVVSAVGAWVWLGQGMNAAQIAGAAVVLGSLASIAVNARIDAVRAAELSAPIE